jgi:hypothetical protein
VYLFAQALWLDVRSPERVPADGLEILHRVFHRQARAFPMPAFGGSPIVSKFKTR